jgi:hypothetical protein
MMTRRGLLAAFLAAPLAARVRPFVRPRPAPIEHIRSLQQLARALEAGYNSDLTKGQALQIEDLTPVMQRVVFYDNVRLRQT